MNPAESTTRVLENDKNDHVLVKLSRAQLSRLAELVSEAIPGQTGDATLLEKLQTAGDLLGYAQAVTYARR